MPIYAVKRMVEHLRQGYAFSTIILGGTLSGLFGALGLALSCMGLYGVVSNAVGQRTREIGIRTALGAGNSGMVLLMLRQSMILVAVGCVLRTVSGIEVSQFLKHVLFSIDPTDTRTFVAVAGILTTVAAIACSVQGKDAGPRSGLAM